MSIGQRWGDVLWIEFGSLESDTLDDGMISILTSAVAPIHCAFNLKVDDMEFACWVVEDCSTNLPTLQDPPAVLYFPGFGHAKNDMRIDGSVWDDGAGLPLRQATLSEVACCSDTLGSALIAVNGTLEDEIFCASGLSLVAELRDECIEEISSDVGFGLDRFGEGQVEGGLVASEVVEPLPLSGPVVEDGGVGADSFANGLCVVTSVSTGLQNRSATRIQRHHCE
ncbi:hypothetical protein Dimus_004207 [Dionaea muscipula]